MSDIFISYSKPGRPVAQKLAALLGKTWTVWWDPKIPPGRRFADVIHEELERARCVVVLWSKHSVKSHYVCEEAEFARVKGTLVPVLVEEAEIPMGFRTIEAAHLVGWNFDEKNEEYANLRAELARRLQPAASGPDATPFKDLAELLRSKPLLPTLPGSPRSQAGLPPGKQPQAPPGPLPPLGEPMSLAGSRILPKLWPGTLSEPESGLGLGQSAAWAKLLAGSAKPVPKTGVIFDDAFADNRNHWMERRDHQRIILRIRNGHYEINHKVEGQGWFVWHEIDIDPTRDFAIEAVIRPWGFGTTPAGRSDDMFGLLWGGKDAENLHLILFEAQGHFAVKTQTEGQWKDVIPWRRSASLAPKSGGMPEIEVGIRKKGQVIEFSANGVWLEDADFAAFFGHNVGFYVKGVVDLWVKRLKVSQG